ncbi:hypothetical protein TNCV_2825441 [Trichonephila clavipes]|nr:hypothetical protein TNCV_2825441 [Trichonephila clavipes]
MSQSSCHNRFIENYRKLDVQIELHLSQPWPLGAISNSFAVPACKQEHSNPLEGMCVCQCTVPFWYVGILNSRRAASPFVRLIQMEERWEAPDHLQDVLPQNCGCNRATSYCHLEDA